MNENEELLKALHKLHIEHQRALSTSVGHPEIVVRKREFRYALYDFVTTLCFDSDTTDVLYHAAMNPIVPQGDALWDD